MAAICNLVNCGDASVASHGCGIAGEMKAGGNDIERINVAGALDSGETIHVRMLAARVRHLPGHLCEQVLTVAN